MTQHPRENCSLMEVSRPQAGGAGGSKFRSENHSSLGLASLGVVARSQRDSLGPKTAT